MGKKIQSKIVFESMSIHWVCYSVYEETNSDVWIFFLLSQKGTINQSHDISNSHDEVQTFVLANWLNK